MAVLDILTYPDPLLKQESRVVEEFGAELESFAEDLVETMQAGPGGVGIAAPQVGRMQRIIVIDASSRAELKNHGLLVLVNPEISKWKGMIKGREGCLSVPDYTGKVIRAEQITLQAQDLNGKACTYNMEAYEARIVQHEIDHLDGLLFIDRVVSRRHDLVARK